MSRWIVLPALAVTVALLAAVTVLAPGWDVQARARPSGPAKGLRPGLVIYRKRPHAVGRLRDGASVAPGDTVQVSYVAAGHHHGVVVSADGSGVVTLHHPTHSSGSTQLLPRGEHPLPHAFQLDDAPAFERFFFVTSARSPIDVNAVLHAARRWAARPSADNARLSLSGNLHQSSVMLRKEAVR